MHAGLAGQRLDVGGVGYPRQAYRRDGERLLPDRRVAGTDLASCDRSEGVLRVDPQPRDEGHHAQNRHAGVALHHLQARAQQRGVAAELIDDKPADPVTVTLIQDRVRADEVRQDPAAVDVACDDHGKVGHIGQAHVGDVGVAEVDLRRAAGTLAEHDVEAGAQVLQGLGDDAAQGLAAAAVRQGADLALSVAAHHHLTGVVRAGFEQHRVEGHVRLQPASERLQRLGAADLAAVAGHGAIIGHVLRLKRRDAHPAPRQKAAHPGHQDGLARVRRTARDQSRCRLPHRKTYFSGFQPVWNWPTTFCSSGSVRISRPDSVTSTVCSNCAVHL